MSCRPLILTMLLVSLPGYAWAVAGDVNFRIPDRVWQLDPGDLTSSLDVLLDIDTQASVPATTWGMVVNITPQAGATGSVVFAPPAIVANQPNLDPAAASPFLDFDRDHGGMSYGELGAAATELNAFAAYVAPLLGPAPTLDGNGNLTLPDASGLAALPIMASAPASGKFLVAFNPNPAVTGVVYATGLAEPDDIALHPVGTHVAGLLSILNPAADYNGDGIVDAADYTVWRDTLGQTGVGLAADGDASGTVDQGDYLLWRNSFGLVIPPPGPVLLQLAQVPEPATLWASLAGLLTAGLAMRARQQDRS